MDLELFALCCGLAVLGALLSFALWDMEKRVRRLERELRAREWEEDATLPRWQSVGGTGNVHRRKLGWRVRLVLWWTKVSGR